MLISDPFWCSAVTSVTFRSNLSNFQNNPKNPKQIPKQISKNPKISINQENKKKSLKTTKSKEFQKLSKNLQNHKYFFLLQKI